MVRIESYGEDKNRRNPKNSHIDARFGNTRLISWFVKIHPLDHPTIVAHTETAVNQSRQRQIATPAVRRIDRPCEQHYFAEKPVKRRHTCKAEKNYCDTQRRLRHSSR